MEQFKDPTFFPPPPEHWGEVTNFVPGEGERHSPIMIIGEAPGAHENMKQRPFVGPAGNVLNTLLHNANIKREECYITNVIKYQPPGNKVEGIAQRYAMDNIPCLLQEIRAVRPKVIVPTGNTALQALGFSYKIGKARGAVIETELGKVIPTYHPAAIFRQWKEIFTAQKDWEKISRHSKTLLIGTYKEEFTINPTIEDVEDYAYFVNNLASNGVKVSLAIDIETYHADHPLKTPIKTIGMALNDTKALVVPFITQSDQNYWDSKDNARRAILAIASILENPHIEKVFFNPLFDILVLMNLGFTVEEPISDMMIGQYLIYHLSPHDLGYVVSIYSDYPPWKLEAGSSEKEFREYNARDCVVLHMIKKDIERDLRDSGLTTVFDINMKQIIPTVKMMLNGIHIDKKRYNDVREMLEKDLEEKRKKIAEVAGFAEFNPESTRHMQNLLFKKLKLRSDVKTKGGAKSTGADVLKRLSLRYPDVEVVNDITEYRTISTRYKTFIKNMYIHDDGRVHSQFSLHTAVTGRYSSSNPNLQNLPSRSDSQGYIRGMYTAEPGKIIVTADYSQLELMIFAVISGDEIWQEAFEQGKDVHALNAEALIGYYDPKYRTFVKNFIYGFIYGSEGGEIERVAPKELIKQLSVSQMLKNLFREHPWLQWYRDKVLAQIKHNNYVVNAFGRRRWYVEKLTKEDIRSAYNFPIQSTAGDIMHIKMPEITAQLKPEEKLILQLHDAFYLEVPERNLDRAANLLKTVMEEPVYAPSGYEFRLKADVSYGTSLSSKDMESYNE